MAISQPQQTVRSVSTANTICCFILWEGRKITFLLLLSGMPHCVVCFSLPWMFGSFIPLARFCPLVKPCPGQVLKHVGHLTRLTAVSFRL